MDTEQQINEANPNRPFSRENRASGTCLDEHNPIVVKRSTRSRLIDDFAEIERDVLEFSPTTNVQVDHFPLIALLEKPSTRLSGSGAPQ
jgi:hypothetical protein